MRKQAEETTDGSHLVDLGRLHEAHPQIRASDWRSPLVHRLLSGEKYQDGSVIIASSFRGVDLKVLSAPLTLRWAGLRDDFDKCVNTYQEPVLTEFATLGLACILLELHTPFRITEVTRRGERVDYWIGDDQVRRRYVLEVSGQQTGSTDALFDAKTLQLQKNPMGRSGFVCVATYHQANARLWFCHHGMVV